MCYHGRPTTVKYMEKWMLRYYVNSSYFKLNLFHLFLHITHSWFEVLG